MSWVQTIYAIPSLSINYSYGGSLTGSWVSCVIPKPTTTFHCQPRVTWSATMRGNPCSLYLQLADSGDTVRYSAPLGSLGSYQWNGFGGICLLPVKNWATADIAKARLVIDVAVTSFVASCTGNMIVWTEGEGTPQGAASLDPEQMAIVTGGKSGQRITRLRYKLAQTLAGNMSWGGTVSGTELHQF